MYFSDEPFFLLLCKIIEKHHLFSLQEVGSLQQEVNFLSANSQLLVNKELIFCILLIIRNKALVEISAFVYKYHCFCQTLTSSCSKEWNLYYYDKTLFFSRNIIF